MDADAPLFPRLDRKKTWLMVKKDLEGVGIPYETPEGIADFHTAGWHSHITGLVRHGATLVEAKELARHADVRQTMKYTHIGLEDQAQALAGSPPLSHQPTLMGCTMAAIPAAPWGGSFQRMTGWLAGTPGPSTSKAPPGRGLRRLVSQTVTN